jgi:tRNA(Ile)-lysidine synthetase-like protein
VLDLQLHEPVARHEFTLASVCDSELAFDYGRIGCSGHSSGETAFSIQAFEGAYVLRSVEVGDKIRIEGGSKAVSDLLNEWGVPMRLKTRAYVLTLDGSVVAVIFSHPGFETRWRVDPKHRGESESSFYISIHH